MSNSLAVPIVSNSLAGFLSSSPGMVNLPPQGGNVPGGPGPGMGPPGGSGPPAEMALTSGSSAYND